MKTCVSAKEMQAQALAWRAAGMRIGVVPTMGYLHEGHLSLMRLARAHADVVVATIFVNPTQFGPREDFAAYPRNLARDEALCREAGVDLVFAPVVDEIYPPDHSVYVVEEKLARTLCGARRPGHFRGVCTIVAKLYNLVLPQVAVFGEKDGQQLRILRRMTRDLNFPVAIIPGPTVREPDGLAMSSRNKYLDAAQRRQAVCLRQALDEAERLFGAGEREAARIIHAMQAVIAAHALAQPDYIEIVDDENLQPVERLTAPVMVALAVFFGKTRLIDNTVLGRAPA